jgi:hypothetical protein
MPDPGQDFGALARIAFVQGFFGARGVADTVRHGPSRR